MHQIGKSISEPEVRNVSRAAPSDRLKLQGGRKLFRLRPPPRVDFFALFCQFPVRSLPIKPVEC